MGGQIDNPVQGAIEQMRLHGIGVADLVADGELHRVDAESGKRGNKAAWYVAHEYSLKDGRLLIVGSFGNWKDGDGAHRFNHDSSRLDESEYREIKRKQAEAARKEKAARRQLEQEAAQRAANIVEKLPTEGRSDYCAKKKISSCGALFSRGSLVVTLHRVDGALVGLQFIDQDGGKKFLTGTPKKGAFHLIGEISEERPLFVAEGFATAASIHMATKMPVAVAFDAGNLKPVAQALRGVYPRLDLVVAGDDDHATPKNPGKTKALEAARAVDGRVVFPAFKESRGRTDFNDMHVEQGLDAVRERLREPFTESRDWEQQLSRSNKGDLKVNIHNLSTVLLNDPLWAGMFRMDTFANRIIKTRKPFYGDAGEYTDIDTAHLAAWFGRPDTWGVTVNVGMMTEAVQVAASNDSFHPVQEYLQQVQWDGKERLPHFFSAFMGANAGEYATAVSLNFFISSVARILSPGCKVDFMVILEGAQGAGKTSAVHKLFGTDWYAEAMESPAHKDFYQSLQGRWGVEIGEMHSFNKAETNKVKQAITAQNDVYRPSYGRFARTFPRQCVFIGTTNDDEYLSDPTGARRFMPLWCSDIDVQSIVEFRDQLWAEAVARFRRGEPWWIFPDSSHKEQEKRYRADAWESILEEWMADLLAPGAPSHDGCFTSADALTDGLKIQKGQINTIMENKLGKVLKRLGVKKVRRRRNKKLKYVYEIPKEYHDG